MGKNALAKGQWHKKTSWRRVSPNAARQRELNWRLDRKLSLGLIGEIGVHQVDALGWFMNERPVAVNGFGSIIQWNDGRNVPDTVQAVFDYPSGARTMYDCTLANSFDASYDMIYGSYAALMMRGARAWMFKEADSPLLGWEVYAKKNSFFMETGISLVANATKLTNHSDDPNKDPEGTKPSRFHALETFSKNCYKHQVAVEDFEALFGDDDPGALAEHLAETNKNKLPKLTTPPKVSVIVPVRNIESGKQRMNEVMHGAMNAQKHKFARYNLTEIKVTDNKRKAGDPILFDTKGTLNVNGKPVPVSMQVSIAKGDEDKLKVSGKTKLRMSQFGISPPAPKITLGLITTDDEVSVEFDWFVALKK